MMLPASALEVRTSAHYIEISRRYMALMAKELIENREKFQAERATLPRQQQLTMYAHPSYKYVPMKNSE